MHVPFTTLSVNDKIINVYVEYKSIKNIYARFRDGVVYVTCRPSTSHKSIEAICQTLLKRLDCKGVLCVEPPVGEDFFYFFGKKERASRGFSEVRLDKMLKKQLISYLDERVEYYERIMGVTKAYKVGVRQMKSRYASNSFLTHRLSFSLKLVHFSKQIIDGVIVHELAHEFQRNHSRKFYEIVLNYYPHYRETDKLLKKGIYTYE